MNKILLFSGGLDSFIAWHMLDKPKPLYVTLRHISMHKEIMAIQVLEKRVKDLNVEFFYGLDLSKTEEQDANIPMRNLYLAMIATQYADNVYLTVQKGETSIPDRTPAFMENASRLLSTLLGREITISSPVLNMSKKEMVEWYLKKELSIDDLLATHSCYINTTMHCGLCSACIRRQVALNLNGVFEATLEDPRTSPLIPNYIERAISGTLEETRSAEFLQWLDNK